MKLNLDQRRDVRAGLEGVASVEAFVGDLDDEVDVDGLGVELLHEVVGGAHGAAGGKEVVVEEDDVGFIDGVLVNLDGVGAVFLGVALLDGGGGELAGLAAEDDAGAEADGECGGDDEAAALDADDLGDALVLVDLVEFVDHDLQAIVVLEEGGDVAEVDAGLGEIWDATQIVHQYFVVHFQLVIYVTQCQMFHVKLNLVHSL